MAQTALTGQDLIDLANARLGGYANAVDTDVLMSYLNEAKDEIWAVIKNLESQYFLRSTQFADNTQVNYFGPMSTTVRQYTLPADLREVQFFEVMSPSGQEQTVFVYKDINDEDFRSARRASNVDSTLTPSVEYFYSIVGKDQLVLAQFPESPFQLVIWYVRNLLDFEVSDTIDEILLPYSKKIANYAVMRLSLGLQDQAQWSAWKEVWKADLVTIASSATPRNEADPTFVTDFLG